MKTVIINRGVSGSGKSTLNKALTEVAESNNLSIKTHSTDDLFMVDGKYRFDVTKLGENHAKNYQNFMQSVKAGTNLVICDNTNIKTWEYKNYVTVALENGYRVIAVVFEPSSLEAHMKRNSHNLPVNVLQKHIQSLGNNMESYMGVDKSFIVESHGKLPFEERIKKFAENILSKKFAENILS